MAFRNEYIIGSQISGTTLSGGTIFSASTNLDEIFIHSAHTIGNGISVFSAKTSGHLIFKSFSGGSGISISDVDDTGTLTFESVPGSEASTVVNAATLSDLTGTTYDNGLAGIGATLTATTNGIIANQDGVVMQNGYLLLVKDQSNQIHNGVYYVTDIGSVSTPYILTRDTSSDETTELSPQLVFVASGTTQKGRYYNQTTADPEVGTDIIVYDLLGGINTYVTQATVGTQVNGRIPTWNAIGRQLRKGNGTLFQNQSTDFLSVHAGTNPTSTLTVAGSFGPGYTGITSNWTADSTNHTIVVNATSGLKTVTLPDASTCFRREYIIKKVDATDNQVIISATTGTVDNAATYTLYNLNDSIMLVSNSVNWIKLNYSPFTEIVNLGSSAAIYSGTTGRTMLFKTISAGTNTTITEEANTITINSTGGGPGGSGSYTDNGINTFTAGTSSFQSVNLNPSISIDSLTASGNSVFSGTLSGGSSFSASSLHSGSTNLENIFVTDGNHLGEHAIFTGKTGSVLQFKGLRAGSNISLTSNLTHLVINASIPSGAYLWMLGDAGNSLVANNGSMASANAQAPYSIVAGQSNDIPNPTSTSSGILAGKGNIIERQSIYSFIGAGGNNYMIYANNSSIVGGSNNKIYNVGAYVSDYSAILGGRYHKICNARYSSIIGGAYNLVSGNTTQIKHSSILGGFGNNITSIYSTILGGYSNLVDDFSGLIGTGNNNQILGDPTSNAFANSTILQGKLHYIFRTKFGSIINGYQNNITNVSNYSSILNGKINVIDGTSQFSTIIGGYNNQIVGAVHSTITGGINYTLTDSYTTLVPKLRIANLPSLANTYFLLADSVGNVTKVTYSAPGGGVGATLWTAGTGTQSIRANNGTTLAGGHFTLVAGKGNVTQSKYSSIAGGSGNTIYGKAYYSFIGGGKFGYINSVSPNSSILTGNGNRIYATGAGVNGAYSTIINGISHVIKSSRGSTILNGQNNAISATTQIAFSSVLGGRQNRIWDESYSTIVNGKGNLISSTYSFNSILNGSGNTILRAASSSILAGSKHTLNTVSNSAIIGGQNYTLTTSNTVLVPLLRIANLPTSANAYSLVADSSGNVTKIVYSATGESNTASNIGSGIGVFRVKTGVDLQFKSLTADTGVSIRQTANEIFFGFSGGTPITGSTFVSGTTDLGNIFVTSGRTIGPGFAVFTGKTDGNILQFKGLSAGTNVTLTTNADTILISASAGPGGSPTYVRNGLNTYTGGTDSSPSVNISGGTFDNLRITGTTLALSSTTAYTLYHKVNTITATTSNPERVSIYDGVVNGFSNVLYGHASASTYAQLNIRNLHPGTTASSDIVATADNGNESTNYVDMGINSSTYTGYLGGVNDAYLYTTGNHMWMGTVTSNKRIYLITDGTGTTNSRLTISSAVTTSSVPFSATSISANTISSGSTALENIFFNRKRVTVITATGAGTYTPTAGMKYVTVIVTGGGGASCDATNTDAVTGGGGGGGTAIRTYSAAEIGASQGYVVGTGGVRNTTPGNGVSTTFGAGGTLITGDGGTGSAAQTAAATLTLNFGGNGGTASGGDINVVGVAGTPGFILTTTIGVGGNGGASYWGAGPTPTASDTAGTTGTNYGSGAAGAHAAGATDRLGANGAQGVIYIEEFI